MNNSLIFGIAMGFRNPSLSIYMHTMLKYRHKSAYLRPKMGGRAARLLPPQLYSDVGLELFCTHSVNCNLVI